LTALFKPDMLFTLILIREIFMKLPLMARVGLIAALAANVMVAVAAQDDIRGAITIINKDCPWHTGSLFAVQMQIDHSQGCYGAASFPRILSPGESVTLDLPFGTNGLCVYNVSGSRNQIPQARINQTVTFSNYYGECRATITN
jgi:hypothetical protein